MSSQSISLPFYEDVLDFLAGGPSSQEIVDYLPPQETQHRFNELLEFNRSGELSTDDEIELDLYVQMDRMLSLLKAKAFRKIDSLSQTK